ncbi:MAG: cobalamin-dependent protein [Polyangiaceae bacterium]
MDKPRTRRRSSGSRNVSGEVSEYSIRLVSRLTNLPPDTLRVWERRYGFPTPKRTPGGSRVYSRAELLMLSLIVRVLDAGYRPGEVVGKSRRELERLLRSLEVVEEPRGTQPGDAALDQLLRTMVRDDVVSLRAELVRAATRLGPKRFVTELAHPACVRVGEGWRRGDLEVRHEHLFTFSLARQLHVMLAAFDEVIRGPRVLLATLPGESHGLGLDMIALYLAAHGVEPRVLGIDSPPEEIAAAATSSACDVVGLSITASSDPNATYAHVRGLRSALPRRVRLWLGGAGARSLKLDAKERASVSTISDFSSLDSAIRSLLASKTAVLKR